MTLLPSATEIVCALGLQDYLVGVSHSCNYPPAVANLPAMTSTRVPGDRSSKEIDDYVRGHLTSNSALYDLDLAALEAAAPDVVVSQALCDVCAVATGDVLGAIESLPSKPQLIDLEPNTLDEVLDDCLRVGTMLGQAVRGEALVRELRERLATVAERSAQLADDQRPKVAFLEWLEPPFNGGHWNPELVQIAGGVDVLGNPGKPSVSLSWAEVAACEPDVMFVACCGFDQARALEDLQRVAQQEPCRSMAAAARLFVADGDAYFSRPGPRLVDGLEIMAHALHPQLHPPAAHGECTAVPGTQ
ncbi:MAG: ABC transporter substrate-binding protein [Woeseiaceae bacterium]|nr:ABC transporter substrate-binding protein [Woeseiaceae bacterium]